MRLLTPTEDILQNTLSALDGLLERLVYLARLQRSDGSYGHWGLAREYGEKVASAALAEVHRRNIEEITRQPLRSIWKETKSSAERQGLTAESYLEGLIQRKSQLMARSLNAPALGHFGYLLHSLSKIARAQREKLAGAAAQHR